ncbi:efflux RND transporter periplasmic adaptor subunit [Hyphomonas sp.]|uniref:efflux RND transporter periplasmic adaptor subunit n=1 Tax=Hyphomonas sp. TaxID=87 RepID=UPI003D2D0664
MKQTFFFTASALGLLLVACDGKTPAPNATASSAEAASASETAQYTCPMHPHYISTDADGSCPICGMDLVPASPADGTKSGATGQILYYKHPMGKADTSPIPKKDSMGMDYIAVYADQSRTDGSIVVDPEMIQTMGVRIAPVEVANFGRSLRAFGTVETNERLENVAVSRIEGWIEDLRVRAEGDTVRPGALLYRVYSPDLIAAQKDYLNSLQIGNDNRISSVKQRLRSLGMQTTTINRLTETRKVIERVPVYAEAGGIVASLQVREGDFIKPGTPILRLQSYSGVWIIASVPEQDLALVDTGMPVRLSFPSAPGAPAEGRINYIYPEIDPKTRTGEVRIEVDNAAGYLRPGAYANISMDLGSEPRLSVPTEAILRDSRGSHVILAFGEGRFAGRTVETGLNAKGRTEILAGLASGEQVVASGQFMLDSEVNLREGLSKLQAPIAMMTGPDTPLAELPVDATTLTEIDHFTDMALYFHEALRDDYKIDPYYVDPAIGLSETLKIRYANTKLVPILTDAEAALRAAKSAVEGDALAVELSRLMTALKPWLIDGTPIHYRDSGLTLYKEAGTERLWLQEGGEPSNPYGDSPAEIVDWPNPMADMDSGRSERAPADPRAGNR